MYTDDFTELEDAIADRMKDAIKSGLEKELKCYIQDSHGEYVELGRISEVTLLRECPTKFTKELERIFGKKDYEGERKYWIKRVRKNGVFKKK